MQRNSLKEDLSGKKVMDGSPLRAFSYGKSQVKDVIAYIENQEQHHKKRTSIEEYIAFLEKFEVEYEQKYIFKELI